MKRLECIETSDSWPAFIDSLKKSRECSFELTFTDPDKAAFEEAMHKLRQEMFGADRWMVGETVNFEDFGWRGTIIDRRLRDDGLVEAVRVEFPNGTTWMSFAETPDDDGIDPVEFEQEDVEGPLT